MSLSLLTITKFGKLPTSVGIQNDHYLMQVDGWLMDVYNQERDRQHDDRYFDWGGSYSHDGMIPTFNVAGEVINYKHPWAMLETCLQHAQGGIPKDHTCRDLLAQPFERKNLPVESMTQEKRMHLIQSHYELAVYWMGIVMDSMTDTHEHETGKMMAALSLSQMYILIGCRTKAKRHAEAFYEAFRAVGQVGEREFMNL